MSFQSPLLDRGKDAPMPGHFDTPTPDLEKTLEAQIAATTDGHTAVKAPDVDFRRG